MLSLLILEVPSFLFAYFTIALKHGVNEVKISFYSLFAYLSLYKVQLYSQDKVLTLLLTLLVTIYPADGFLVEFAKILSF